MKRNIRVITSLWLLYLAAVISVVALTHGDEQQTRLEFAHTTIVMTPETNVLHNLLSSPQPARRMLFLVQVKDENSMALMEQLLGQKPNHVFSPTTFAFYVENVKKWAKRTAKQNEAELMNHVSWMSPMKPEYKTSLNFAMLEQNQLTANSRSLNAEESKIDLIAILATHSIEQSEKLVARINGRAQVYSTYSGSVNTNINSVQINLASPNKLRVVASYEVASRVLNMLKEQEEIVWIERRLSYKSTNYFANIIVQGSGSVSDNDINNDVTPIWDQGITGKGEIVGVGDTGLDYDNCFFNDPNMPSIPFDTPIISHRKLVAYNTLTLISDGNTVKSDRKDLPDGHGTHVCGSVAGHPTSKLAKFAGIAKDAKIHFTDLENSDQPGTLLVPDDLYLSYFRRPFQQGVRIHSSSWGCSYGSFLKCQYDCVCTWTTSIPRYGVVKGTRAEDLVCQLLFGTRCCQVCTVYDSSARDIDRFTHENQDMLIIYSAGNYGDTSSQTSITSPATSKNGLSVGASMNHNKGFLDHINYVDFEELFEYLVPFNVSSVAQCCASPLRAIRTLCCPETMRQYYSQQSVFNQNNMAPFSSRGPTLDGRIKPDVVAPGMKIISAHSDGNTRSFQCSDIRPEIDNQAAMLSMEGTSMAAPVVAGSAALVRQFYRSNNQNPSGYLIKATLIHSAQNMHGHVFLDGSSVVRNLPASPNIYNGFGLVSLGSVLFPSNQPTKLFTFDRQSVSLSSDAQKYCFTSTGASQEFKATLTWYDPPGPLGTSQSSSLLVNNLDLTVSVAAPGSQSSTITFYGNDVPSGDSMNNVEVVKVGNVIKTAGYRIQVTVRAQKLAALYPTQTFAVIVTGQVQQVNC